MADRGRVRAWSARILRFGRAAAKADGDGAQGDPSPVQVADARLAAVHGERALELAGRALDPNAPGGPSLALGQLLLREAFIAAARAIGRDAAVDSIDRAAETLAGRRPSDESGGRAERLAQAIDALRPSSAPDRVALARAEMAVAELLDEASAGRRILHARRRARWSLALIAAAVAGFVLFTALVQRRPWEDYRWSASSAWEGFTTSGTLGEHGAHDLLFHTQEQPNPWILIDLLATRTIHEVVVENRTDWGRDRGLPVVLELAEEDRRFERIRTRRVPFDEWRVTFPSRKARYVRLRAVGTTILHYREIRIR